MTDAPLLRKTPNALADRLTRLRNAGNAYLDYTIFLELGALLEKRSSTNVFTAIGTQRSQSLRGAHEQAGTIKHKGARNSAPSAQRTYTYGRTQTTRQQSETSRTQTLSSQWSPRGEPHTHLELAAANSTSMKATIPTLSSCACMERASDNSAPCFAYLACAARTAGDNDRCARQTWKEKAYFQLAANFLQSFSQRRVLLLATACRSQGKWRAKGRSSNRLHASSNKSQSTARKLCKSPHGNAL